MKKSKHALRRALQVLPLVPAAIVGADVSSALPGPPKPPPPPPPPPAPPGAPTFKLPPPPPYKDINVLRIRELQLSPAMPRVGQSATLTMRVENQSPAPLPNVEWKFSGSVSKQGVIASLAPHSSQTVSHTFTVQGSEPSFTGQVDPNNRIAEPQPLRQNNTVTLKIKTTSSSTEWDGWVRKAAERTNKLVDLAKRETSVSGTINATVLRVHRLKVGSLDLVAMRQALTDVGIPADIASGMVDAFVATYTTWAAKYAATIPFAFLGFAAYPLAVVPPTPNVPFPVALGGSPDGEQALLPTTMAALLKNKMSAARRAQPGIDEALGSYAAVLSSQLHAWMAVQPVFLLGTGPVPSFAPPYVPVGPVVMGTVVPARSHLP
ncbi:MAG: CARDB domain-containing protein [Polyangiaceae bacterium]